MKSELMNAPRTLPLAVKLIALCMTQGFVNCCLTKMFVHFESALIISLLSNINPIFY